MEEYDTTSEEYKVMHQLASDKISICMREDSGSHCHTITTNTEVQTNLTVKKVSVVKFNEKVEFISDPRNGTIDTMDSEKFN